MTSRSGRVIRNTRNSTNYFEALEIPRRQVMTQFKLQIDLNEHSLKQILDKVREDKLYTDDQLNQITDYSDVVKRFFIRLI